MDGEILKLLYTAKDATGRELRLARLHDGCWGILLEGECRAVGWPRGDLAGATRACREMILQSGRLDSAGDGGSP